MMSARVHYASKKGPLINDDGGPGVRLRKRQRLKKSPNSPRDGGHQPASSKPRQMILFTRSNKSILEEMCDGQSSVPRCLLPV
jgi:hypothetical protein